MSPLRGSRHRVVHRKKPITGDRRTGTPRRPPQRHGLEDDRVCSPTSKNESRAPSTSLSLGTHELDGLPAPPEDLENVPQGLQRIEGHELGMEGSSQPAHVLLCLFQDGQRRKKLASAVVKSKEGYAAFQIYRQLRLLAGHGWPEHRPPPAGLPSIRESAKKRVGDYEVVHPVDSRDEEARRKLESIHKYQVRMYGNATQIEFLCTWLSGETFWVSEPELQRTYNAAVLTYWACHRRPVVTTRYIRILAHTGEGDALQFEVQWLGYTACRNIKTGLMDATWEPAKKVKREFREEYDEYVNEHKLDVRRETRIDI